MNNEQRINDEVEKTLEAYRQDGPVEADPWLTTRILSARRAGRFRGAHLLPVRMDLRLAAVLALVLLNLVTLAWYGWGRRGNVDADLVVQLQVEFQMDQTETNF